MKKLLVMMAVLSITTLGALAVEPQQKPHRPEHNSVKAQEIRKAKEAEFEKKLGLTEEQKIQAKEIRKQGFERIKPVIEQIKDKKKEAEMVKLSRIAIQAQEEKLAVLDEEIKELEKQAMEIRKKNMKEFESILTAKQKKILKNMKKEGRKNYHAAHPVHK